MRASLKCWRIDPSIPRGRAGKAGHAGGDLGSFNWKGFVGICVLQREKK